ncbi:MAG: hypothetical protein ABI867_17495 [Kofleriaceae bacterium]
MRILAAAILGLGLGACGGKADDALDKLDGFKNQICACADKACAETAMRSMETYMNEWSKSNQATKPSKAQADRSEKITNEMAECVKKLETK